jgi:AraC-like DNA-binding protein
METSEGAWIHGARAASALRPAPTAGGGRDPHDIAPVPYGALLQHVRANLSRRIAVDELAGIARLSAFQLFRAFRRDRAITPYRFVLEVRIEHAKAWLSTGATIADAACQAGFADQSHLTRHFKRLTGMTPKAYADRWAPREACQG